MYSGIQIRNGLQQKLNKVIKCKITLLYRLILIKTTVYLFSGFFHLALTHF